MTLSVSNSSKPNQNQGPKREFRKNAALILERKDNKILICEGLIVRRHGSSLKEALTREKNLLMPCTGKLRKK